MAYYYFQLLLLSFLVFPFMYFPFVVFLGLFIPLCKRSLWTLNYSNLFNNVESSHNKKEINAKIIQRANRLRQITNNNQSNSAIIAT